MKICVLRGDGIGPEITAEALRVLEALRSDGLPIETEQALIGGSAVDASGVPLPPETQETPSRVFTVRDITFSRVSGRSAHFL